MALMIIVPDFEVTSWVKTLSKLAPDIDIRVWPDAGEADDIEFALSWHHPPAVFKKYRNLKCIASMGAGVDHILRDPDLPAGVPITRVVDHSMAQSMSEYVVFGVLNYCRGFEIYLAAQAQKLWKPRKPLLAQNTPVGIMGLGQLGADAARKLNALGFTVSGWSRTPKEINAVRCFSGNETLADLLSRSQILVCLLPLTKATSGILNRNTFEKLPAGAYVINVARGQHLIENDLIDALDSGHLAGACLDVFDSEPLPQEHPFWRHPKIIVTPHISSITLPAAVAPQIIENYRRVQLGRSLRNVVDVNRGY